MAKRRSLKKGHVKAASNKVKTVSLASAVGHDVKQLSRAQHEEIVSKRPKVDFSDPFMRSSAMQAKGVSLCAYLVTLAAFQRGLKVTFHYQFATKFPKFRNAIIQGHRGEQFTISNGNRMHSFSRTLGDVIDPKAIAIGEDKHQTKAVLRKAGVRTPPGIIVNKDQITLVEKFIQNNPEKRFVVKPYNGTLGRDVYTNLRGSEVVEKFQLIKNDRLIVEEYIEGMEYRVFVVGYRYISCFLRAPANVIGDGENNIERLIEIKNAKRKTNPRLLDDMISDFEAISKFLAISGKTLKTVPSLGEKVVLLATSSVLAGGDPVDCTSDPIGDLDVVAEAACKAMGIPISGLDVIVREEGGEHKAYVLELNQKPHINAQSFPMDTAGPGNIVAEAIIDYYFPETIQNRTFPRLSYDFKSIRNALESSQVAEISLPLIGNDWNVMRFELQGESAQRIYQVMDTASKISGVFIAKSVSDNNSILICLAYSAVVFTRFLQLLPEKLRQRIEAEDIKNRA